MARIVQKFGGSSVANAERIFRVAKIITDAYAKGNEMCVVLSAQGDTTDDLIAKAEEINPNASKREMDMLLACGEQMSIALMAMAIEKLGYPVVSLCGWQVGMNTSSTHSFARIKKVTCERVKEELDKKRIVLVADYFGLLPKFLLEVSPFHGSIFFTSMGSLGIPPIVHHLYDFGNLPVFCAFGCKYRKNEIDMEGNLVQRKYIDFTVNTDERICDGFYFATALKHMKKFLQHPERLDEPLDEVVKDVD